MIVSCFVAVICYAILLVSRSPSSSNQWDRNPRPQLEPQITSSERCNANQTILETPIYQFQEFHWRDFKSKKRLRESRAMTRINNSNTIIHMTNCSKWSWFGWNLFYPNHATLYTTTWYRPVFLESLFGFWVSSGESLDSMFGVGVGGSYSIGGPPPPPPLPPAGVPQGPRTILYHIISDYIMLCYTIPYYTILYYTIVLCYVLFWHIIYYIILHYTVVYDNIS